jgi:TRAP-type C4-dicarboxylate transport system permease small subunit
MLYLISLSIILLFLFLTAWAGTKFYEINMQKKDIGAIKFLILSAFVISAIIMFLLFKDFNARLPQETHNQPQIEKVAR